MKFVFQRLFPRVLLFFYYSFLLKNKNLYSKREDESPLPLMELFIEEQLSLCWGKAPPVWLEQLEIVLSHARNWFHWLQNVQLYTLASVGDFQRSHLTECMKKLDAMRVLL